MLFNLLRINLIRKYMALSNLKIKDMGSRSSAMSGVWRGPA